MDQQAPPVGMNSNNTYLFIWSFQFRSTHTRTLAHITRSRQKIPFLPERGKCNLVLVHSAFIIWCSLRVVAYASQTFFLCNEVSKPFLSD